MEQIGIILMLWLLYLIPFAPIALPLWFFGRKRVQWTRWDFAMILLPIAIWCVLIMNYGRGKSMSNIAEAFWLGCAAPVAPILRLVVGSRANQRVLAVVFLTTTCILGVALWAFVPGLPE